MYYDVLWAPCMSCIMCTVHNRRVCSGQCNFYFSLQHSTLCSEYCSLSTAVHSGVSVQCCSSTASVQCIVVFKLGQGLFINYL